MGDNFVLLKSISLVMFPQNRVLSVWSAVLVFCAARLKAGGGGGTATATTAAASASRFHSSP